MSPKYCGSSFSGPIIQESMYFGILFVGHFSSEAANKVDFFLKQLFKERNDSAEALNVFKTFVSSGWIPLNLWF